MAQTTASSPAPRAPGALSTSDIVTFFDEQLSEGVRVPELIERAAVFAGAAVGRSDPLGDGVAHHANGTPRDAARPEAVAFRALSADTGDTVWTDLANEQLAAVFLERLTVAVRVIERWSALRADAEPQPLAVLIDRASSQAAKALALGQLSLTPETLVRLVVCTGPAPGVERLVASLPTASIIARTMHDARAVLLLRAEPAGGSIELATGVPMGVRAAYGHIVPATHTAIGFINASDTHRFSRPSPHDEGPYRGIDAVWLNGARASTLAALAHLDREYIALLPDVQTLERLAQRHGDRILHVLEAYATTESMRKAATLVYMHHNSVLYWVQKAEGELGYALAEPYQRALLFISLCLHRIWRDED